MQPQAFLKHTRAQPSKVELQSDLLKVPSKAEIKTPQEPLRAPTMA